MLLGACAVLVGAAVSLLRQPGLGALDTIWAEDGSEFLAGAADDSFVTAITTSYNGYLHGGPRLLAEIAVLAPADAAAAVLAVEAALCTALLAALVFVASAGHLSSTLARVLVAGIVPVVPVAHGDVPNSVANLHWFGLYALFWVLIWVPAGRLGRFAAALVVLLVAASDILAVVLVPLALARALRLSPTGARERFGALLAGLLGVGVAMHLAGLIIGTSSRPLAPDPVFAVGAFVVRAVPAAVLGERWVGPDCCEPAQFALVGTAWIILAVAVFLAAGRITLGPRRRGSVRQTRPAWPLAATAAVHAAVLYIVPVLLTGIATPRYAVAPALLLVTALAALFRPGAGRRGAVPLVCLAALLTVVAAVNLRTDNERAHGPSWQHELRDARQRCSVPGVTMVDVAHSPQRDGFSARLPCDYVRR